MKMVDIMKKLGIKNAEWIEIESGLDGFWVTNMTRWNKDWKKFDTRIDRKYMKDYGTRCEYRYFQEDKQKDGWVGVVDTNYQPVRIYKDYYVDKHGHIFRVVFNGDALYRKVTIEQFVMNDEAVTSKNYL